MIFETKIKKQLRPTAGTKLHRSVVPPRFRPAIPAERAGAALLPAGNGANRPSLLRLMPFGAGSSGGNFRRSVRRAFQPASPLSCAPPAGGRPGCLRTVSVNAFIRFILMPYDSTAAAVRQAKPPFPPRKREQETQNASPDPRKRVSPSDYRFSSACLIILRTISPPMLPACLEVRSPL